MWHFFSMATLLCNCIIAYSENYSQVPPVKKLRKQMRNQALRCHVLYSHDGSKLNVIPVWKAELVLIDFILHKSFTTSYFNDAIAIELGAGTGSVGIVLSRVAMKVFITDKGVHILNNCDSNTHVNSSMLKCKDNTICVRELDWMDSWPPNVTIDSSS